MFAAVPLNGETWLICGGRRFWDRNIFDNVMTDLLALRGCPSRIVHGGASGADSMGMLWGKAMALEVVRVNADWNTHGRAAGSIRNQKMLDDYSPSLVVAFPGGFGTADMVARARKAKIDVAEIKGII